MEKRVQTVQLKLNSLTLDQLKDYANKYTKHEPKYIESLPKNDLLQILAEESKTSNKFQLEINSLKVTYKPSFFVLAFNSPVADEKYKSNIKLKLNKSLAKTNSNINRGSGNPLFKNFEHIDSKLENDILEFHIVWQKLHWYWSPDSFALDKIYELNYGISLIDFNSKKAIISCHSVEEKDIFVDIIKDTFDIKLNTLVLTKPLLEKIGSYDKVKRARYFLSKNTTKMPENITYADDKLSIKPAALELENDPDSERKESFYRIPLGTVLEQGVGVTSDSGKLWIPKYYPIDVIKDFALELLAQITGTLDALSKNGNLKTVFETLGIGNIKEIQKIKPIDLRNEITRLIFELLVMVDKKEGERPFTINKALVNSSSIPRLFNYPRMEVFDDQLDLNAYFKDDISGSQLINIKQKKTALEVYSYPSNQRLNLDYLEHPISGNNARVYDLYSALELIPTPELQSIINNTFQYLASQFSDLTQFHHIPFRIKSNKLLLGLSILSDEERNIKNTEIFTTDILQLKQVVNKPIDKDHEISLKNTVMSLNEKCDHCDDINCRACTRSNSYICLRSLVGFYLKNPYILNHKGIELCDIQGRLDFKQNEIIIYGFSKQSKSKSLTARNGTGSILLAQVLGQIDKVDFDTVLIITPNILSDDLYNRLRLLCNVFEKRLLLFDHEIMKLLLNEYEIRNEFDQIDVAQVYRSSNKSLKRLNPKK